MKPNYGDKFVLNYGVPPTNAHFTIMRRKGRKVAICHNAQPRVTEIKYLLKVGAEPVNDFNDIPAFACLTCHVKDESCESS